MKKDSYCLAILRRSLKKDEEEYLNSELGELEHVKIADQFMTASVYMMFVNQYNIYLFFILNTRNNSQL